MKSKLLILLILITLITSGCNKTNDLTCTAKLDKDGRKTNSKLIVKFEDDEIKDMTLHLDITLSTDQLQYKQAMMSQILQKTNKVTETSNGLKATFDMDSDYFNTLGLSKDVSYNEIKQILELQGYTCK